MSPERQGTVPFLFQFFHVSYSLPLSRGLSHHSCQPCVELTDPTDVQRTPGPFIFIEYNLHTQTTHVLSIELNEFFLFLTLAPFTTLAALLRGVS